jgi:hypothetical protein
MPNTLLRTTCQVGWRLLWTDSGDVSRFGTCFNISTQRGGSSPSVDTLPLVASAQSALYLMFILAGQFQARPNNPCLFEQAGINDRNPHLSGLRGKTASHSFVKA